MPSRGFVLSRGAYALGSALAVLLQVLQETVFASIDSKRRFMATAGRVLTRQVLPVLPLRMQ